MSVTVLPGSERLMRSRRKYKECVTQPRGKNACDVVLVFTLETVSAVYIKLSLGGNALERPHQATQLC